MREGNYYFLNVWSLVDSLCSSGWPHTHTQVIREEKTEKQDTHTQFGGDHNGEDLGRVGGGNQGVDIIMFHCIYV